MSDTLLTTIERAFRVIDCFDLAPEAIDGASFAALAADLWLDAEDAGCAADDMILANGAEAPAPLAPLRKVLA